MSSGPNLLSKPEGPGTEIGARIFSNFFLNLQFRSSFAVTVRVLSVLAHRASNSGSPGELCDAPYSLLQLLPPRIARKQNGPEICISEPNFLSGRIVLIGNENQGSPNMTVRLYKKNTALSIRESCSVFGNCPQLVDHSRPGCARYSGGSARGPPPPGTFCPLPSTLSTQSILSWTAIYSVTTILVERSRPRLRWMIWRVVNN